MDILGIGPLELVAILLIIFIVMGPTDIAKMANTLGKTLGNLRRSEMWTAMQRAQSELRSLPDTLAKQAELEELREIKKEIEKDLSATSKDIKALDQELVAWTRRDGPRDAKEIKDKDTSASPEEDDQIDGNQS
jgi:Sec-independent protein translocase protein TatA